jgi:hypothetical protein
MGILGYLIIALIVIILGVAIAIDLRTRRHKDRSGDSPEERRLRHQSARRDAQERRTARRAPDDPRFGGVNGP